MIELPLIDVSLTRWVEEESFTRCQVEDIDVRCPVVEPVIASEQTPVSEWPRQHAIAHGDTFYSIAKTYYGDGSKWELIAEANPDAQVTGLLVGKTIKIPDPGS